jgi:hypothetical protein
MKNLYLIEFYTNRPGKTNDGWEINFAWVYAWTKPEAKAKLAKQQGPRFDCVITCEQQAEVSALTGHFRVNTDDANLFFIN